MKVDNNRGLFCFQSSKRRLYLENESYQDSYQVLDEEACLINLFRVNKHRKEIFEKKNGRDVYKKVDRQKLNLPVSLA